MRVDWARYSGEDIEQVIAMMLCRRFPNATRIRPSRGDGGVDVLVPIPTGYAVWQIKKFAANLTSSQKSQIRGSIDRVLQFIEERGLPVPEWHLIMPLEPTHENREWLDRELKDADFNHFWHGLEYVDGLASDYPSAIDYYLRDGKDRLRSAMEDLAAAMALQEVKPPLNAGDATKGLAGVFRTINELDPHYRYEFDVAATQRDPPLEPDLVFATTMAHGDAHVTYRVYALCKESPVERPVRIALSIPLEEHPELLPEIEAFTKYGTGFTTPRIVEVNADLPGGLGGRLSKAVVRVGHNGGSETFLRRFQAVTPDQSVAAEAKVRMSRASTGLDGSGVRTVGEEANGVFTCEILTDLSGKMMTIKIRLNDIGGRAVVDVVDGVRFLDQLGSPNRLRICLPAGPPSVDPIPQVFPSNEDPATRRLVENLLTIQEHTSTQIVVPPESEMTVNLLRELDEIARLLRGEQVVSYLSSMTINMAVLNANVPEGPQQLVIDQDLAIKLSGETIPLGRHRIVVPAAEVRVERAAAGEPGGIVHLTALPNRKLESRSMLLPTWPPSR